MNTSRHDTVIREQLANYCSLLQNALIKFPVDDIARLVDAIDTARCSNRRVYTVGNGGSSATASHFASDLSKGATNPVKPRIKAHCLTDDTPAVMAWANDTEYSNVFAGQFDGYIESGDIVVALSVGGNSPNIVAGLVRARELGAVCVAVVGRDGGGAMEVADITVRVPEWDTERVEDLHSAVCHSVTYCLRNMTTKANLSVEAEA